MRIWTSEHVFNHSWETVTTGQWQKYPNPHNQAVLGTDVVDRRVENGVLHSHRSVALQYLPARILPSVLHKLLNSNGTARLINDLVTST